MRDRLLPFVALICLIPIVYIFFIYNPGDNCSTRQEQLAVDINSLTGKKNEIDTKLNGLKANGTFMNYVKQVADNKILNFEKLESGKELFVSSGIRGIVFQIYPNIDILYELYSNNARFGSLTVSVKTTNNSTSISLKHNDDTLQDHPYTLEPDVITGTVVVLIDNDELRFLLNTVLGDRITTKKIDFGNIEPTIVKAISSVPDPQPVLSSDYLNYLKSFKLDMQVITFRYTGTYQQVYQDVFGREYPSSTKENTI